MPDVGSLITEARKRRGWTITELAAAAGVDRGNLSKVERGERGASLDMLLALARVIDIDLNLLVKSDGLEDAPTEIA